jgi:EAL domain-containing protein (putative c-di-GMP-specific phosphodiesterase class I)/GGDEF domain-containing protein
MSLKKQLYIILSFIFLTIFVGNFIITMKNTKNYLEEESYTKSFDTATTLGMLLKKIISNKNDPEIALTINAISDSGFYKEIRLENLFFNITDRKIIENSNIPNILNISNVFINKENGTIELNKDTELENELNGIVLNNKKDTISTYTFVPSEKFKDSNHLKIHFTYNDKGTTKTSNIILNLSTVIYKKIRDEKFDNVPQWFIDFINLDIKEARSDISDGWQTTASIYISANSGIAYEKLYIQLEETLLYSSLAFIFSLILLAIFLRFILKPLENVKNVAQEISNGNFIQIENIPWSKELKSVSLSINKMSLKIENMINELSKNIEDITIQLSQDTLTKLELKQSFETEMKKMFMSKEKGYVFIIKIDALANLSNIMGRNDLDNFLIDFANILKNIKDAKAFRFFGSEFALILKNDDDINLQNLIKILKEKYSVLCDTINQKSIVHIGIIKFDEFSSLAQVLSGANEAYEMSKQIGPNEIFIKKQSDVVNGTLAWKDIVNNVVNNNQLSLEFIGDTFDTNTNITIFKETFSKVMDLENNQIPIGVFISMAQKYERIIDFDKIVINKVIEYIKINNIQCKIVINLSFETIVDSNFINWLINIIEKNSNISSQLIFSLTSYGVANNIEKTIEFCKIIQSTKSLFMIKRFEVKFISTDILGKINPNIIRLARETCKGISKDENKYKLVDSICRVANILDIKIYAENIIDNDDLEKISNLSIDGFSK